MKTLGLGTSAEGSTVEALLTLSRSMSEELRSVNAIAILLQCKGSV